MAEPLSPGQAAYAAWWRTRYGMQQADEISAYQMLPAPDRRAWDAAAQAVLEAFVSSAQPLAHWGEPHVTDDTSCFCGAREEGGVVIHRRMPWERPGQREGEA